MSVTIGPHTFPVVHYDPTGDVLYLHTSTPDHAVDFDDSPEGHGLRFGADGALVGITILNARWELEHHGKIALTLPAQHVEADAGALNGVLAAA